MQLLADSGVCMLTLSPFPSELEDSNGRDKERTSARCRGEANSPESRTSADSFAQELEALRQKNAILEIENSKLKERSVEAPAYMK